MTTQKPILKLKDGLLAATVWKNETEDGKTITTVSLTRSYKKGDDWHETSSFSRQELHRILALGQMAYDELSAIMIKREASEAE